MHHGRIAGLAPQRARLPCATYGRFFRLADGQGHELAIGRLYDPSGQNELAPLDDFGRQNLGALNIEFRAEGDWRTA
jgi:hypothetical protein